MLVNKRKTSGQNFEIHKICLKENTLIRYEDALHELGLGGGAVRPAEGRRGDAGEPGVRHRPQELHPQAAGKDSVATDISYIHSIWFITATL